MVKAYLSAMLMTANADFTPWSHNYVLETPAAKEEMKHQDFAATEGVVGLAVNGIPFVSAHFVDGKARPSDHQFDDCAGHGDDEGHYHYHMPPTCLLSKLGSATPSVNTWWHGNNTHAHWPKQGEAVKIGTALDGMTIFGPYHPETKELIADNSKLDECHGMTLENGEYAYFLTASAPFLPPCLKFRPGSIQGLDDESGAPCQAGENQPGCPDHRFFEGSTTDEEATTARRLTCAACGTEGCYIVDDSKNACAAETKSPWTYTYNACGTGFNCVNGCGAIQGVLVDGCGANILDAKIKIKDQQSKSCSKKDFYYEVAYSKKEGCGAATKIFVKKDGCGSYATAFTEKKSAKRDECDLTGEDVKRRLSALEHPRALKRRLAEQFGRNLACGACCAKACGVGGDKCDKKEEENNSTSADSASTFALAALPAVAVALMQ